MRPALGRRLARAGSIALVGLGLGLLILSGLLLTVSLAEKEAGGGNPLADSVEQYIRRHEALHYRVHLAAGRLLSILPPTRGLAAEQDRKASFHVPADEMDRRALQTRLPKAQADALLACQGYVRDALDAEGVTPIFPPVRGMTQEDIDHSVLIAGNGIVNVVQPFKRTGAATAPYDDAYSCGVRQNAIGRWELVRVGFLG